MNKLEPHVINIDELKKGQVIFVRLIDVYQPLLNDTYDGFKTKGGGYLCIEDDLNMAEHGLVGKMAWECIDQFVTMLKYDGDGVFYEWFSKKPVKYINPQEVSSVDNYEFQKIIDDLKQYPIRVSYYVDEDVMALNGLGQLITDYSNEVKNYITSLDDIGIYEDEVIKIKHEFDYETASGENAYRDFQQENVNIYKK